MAVPTPNDWAYSGSTGLMMPNPSITTMVVMQTTSRI